MSWQSREGHKDTSSAYSALDTTETSVRDPHFRGFQLEKFTAGLRMSLINTAYNRGLSTQPCGTPACTPNQSEHIPSCIIRNFLPVRKERSQRNKRPSTPISLSLNSNAG